MYLEYNVLDGVKNTLVSINVDISGHDTKSHKMSRLFCFSSIERIKRTNIRE